LGGLRLAASCRSRGSVIRRGFDFFRQLHEQGGPPIYLTSIISDNLRARRLLERGSKGMPTYRFLGEFVTLIIRRRPQGETQKRLRSLRSRFLQDLLRVICDTRPTEAVLNLLNGGSRQYQFAPAWSSHELQLQEFRSVCWRDGTPAACAAIWDQRAPNRRRARLCKKSGWVRPLINLGGLVLPGSRLPRLGDRVSHAFVSHLVATPLQPHL
jgi:hypothetical protein